MEVQTRGGLRGVLENAVSYEPPEVDEVSPGVVFGPFLGLV